LRFLIDENIFPKITSYLRSRGHDVKSLQEERLFMTADDKIIQIAKDEVRTVITFDRHFGNVTKYPPHNTAGIIHIRIHPPLMKDILPAIDSLFKNFAFPSFHGKLIVLSRNGYRVRSK